MLEAIHQSTQKIEQDVESVRRTAALAQLDSEWLVERESYMVKSHDGGRDLPSSVAAIASGIAGILIGIVVFVVGSKMEMPVVALFGFGAVALGIVMMAVQLTKASAYRQAEARYQERRRRLLYQ